MERERTEMVEVNEEENTDGVHVTKTYQTTEVVYQEYEPSCLQRCSNRIIRVLETMFYMVGLYVARHPFLTILLSLSLCGLCGIGLMRFEQTTDDAKLWVPKQSRVLPEKAWVDENFPQQYRFTSVIVTAYNIFSPTTINSMYDMYLQSRMTFTVDNKNLDYMCVKIGHMCHVKSLLELWQYNGTIIRSLTLDDILQTVNQKIAYSPTYGTEFSLEYMLGGIRRDNRGKILGAESATMLWVLHKNPEFETAALDWEKQMIDMVNAGRPYFAQSYIYATRTFDDEGYGAVKADTSLLTAGFMIVYVFIILVLGRFNMVENKLYVSLTGIFTIGLSILFSYGLAMGFGFLYGPIHNMMPFLLLGIGVDDMFVIVGAWQNLSPQEQKLPIDKKMALTLKHAGVSITVTSVTDIVAFAIGSSTVIPALSAFCAYAAFGILGLYFLVSTFFVAILTLDERRISDNRNSVIFCYKHKNYVPNSCSKRDIIGSFIKKIYGPTLMKLPCKVCVVIVTAVLVCVNIWSFTMLRQDFNIYDYLPQDSYATEYVQAQLKYYPDRGFDASIYCDGMDYFVNRRKLEAMYSDVTSDPYIQNGSVVFWYPAFTNYLKTTQDSMVTSQVKDGFPQSSEAFNSLLLYFLQQREGRSFGQFIKFDNSSTPTIQATYIPFFHTHQASSAGDIDAMDSLMAILDKANFVNGSCFSYGFKYLNNETNRVLKGELYRNLALAGLCVFIVTLLLISNLWTSILVFSCVAFTVIDVTGTLQFWDVTIDTATSILITLSVGLAVDYSAHVGHMFMTLLGDREDRAKATLCSIGPAVLNGGLSTFLAFVLLANSTSYGFMLFFRVFMTVVIFGLYHGLVYLPVILSWVGPSPYPSEAKMAPKHNGMADPKHLHDGAKIQGNGHVKGCFCTG
ncbi:protein patched homolog 3-like isoform X2 [Mya arenaria]|uniref:protein patched homolog 3-like n=1 Tax=Mya arenaria TaxID=6604 RepID=UPI0022E26AB1|nr:protein patched homolog 3-like [Mya arenaria]XP_052775869.1 protein patched homolog 3-like [Mya arenaria]XP_052775870.1 protein patched homolog 3-like [Mya arenaria]XP_052775871.1 protein patched homolog 3-like [Mya arenaria]XP_052775872.1 protein patched homolog 3-like [Mya arenaria]XP_052776213.1 protein patched homolog 3-like isoform X2 [Mya arenaria]